MLHNTYRNIWHQYHYAKRKLRNHRREIRNDNLVKAATNGQINDILKDLKHQRKPASNLSSRVDGKTDPQIISNHFGSLYKDIYNHHDDQADILDISDEINQTLSGEDLSHISCITPQLLEKLITKLKLDKNDEHYNFKTNAFKISSYLISKPLCQLIKSYLIHRYFTNSFLFSSLVIV